MSSNVGDINFKNIKIPSKYPKAKAYLCKSQDKKGSSITKINTSNLFPPQEKLNPQFVGNPEKEKTKFKGPKWFMMKIKGRS